MPFWQFALAVTALVLIVARLLPEPATSAVFVGRTETLGFRPYAASLTTIGLGRVTVGTTGACVSGLVLRPLDQRRPRLEIFRSVEEYGKVVLIASGGWSWQAANGRRGIFLSEQTFSAGADDESCKAGKQLRIPVSGPVIIGNELANGDVKLLSGVITIFARSLDRNTVYQASRIDVPPNSRIGLALDDGGGPRWIGFAAIDLLSETPGFDVNVSTAARAVPIIMPASALPGGKTDLISIGLFAQLGGDPLIQWIVGILLFLGTFLGLAGQRWPTGNRK